jgi:hypothetical protein
MISQGESSGVRLGIQPTVCLGDAELWGKRAYLEKVWRCCGKRLAGSTGDARRKKLDNDFTPD